MEKYQLTYNGNACYPLCNTIEEAEEYKQRAAAQWPEIKVEIKQVNKESAQWTHTQQ